MFWPKGGCLACNLTNLPIFSIIFLVFSTTFLYATWTTPSLNCRHPLMCGHTSHRPYKYPPHTFCSWQWTHWNPWCNSWHFSRHCLKCWLPRGRIIITCASFNHNELLSSMNQHCVYQRWHLHLSQRCHCWPNANGYTSSVVQFKDLLPLMQLKPRKGAIITDTPLIDSSF